jgi:hypothetical protein
MRQHCQSLGVKGSELPSLREQLIFGGAHWGHTSLESDNKRPQASTTLAAGQATLGPEPAGQKTT